MTIDDLIDNYKRQVSICAKIDYLDKKTVRANNKAVEVMYEIVDKLKNDITKDSILEFAKLLDISKDKTNVWAATHLLERLQPDHDTEKKALSIIKAVANGQGPEALGFRIWLKDWKSKK